MTEFEPHKLIKYSRYDDVLCCEILSDGITMDMISNIKSKIMTRPTKYFEDDKTLQMTCKFLDDYKKRLEQLLEKNKQLKKGKKMVNMDAVCDEFASRPMKILQNSNGTEILIISFEKSISMWMLAAFLFIWMIIFGVFRSGHPGKLFQWLIRPLLPNMYFKVELQSSYSVQTVDPSKDGAKTSGFIITQTNKVEALM